MWMTISKPPSKNSGRAPTQLQSPTDKRKAGVWICFSRLLRNYTAAEAAGVCGNVCSHEWSQFGGGSCDFLLSWSLLLLCLTPAVHWLPLCPWHVNAYSLLHHICWFFWGILPLVSSPAGILSSWNHFLSSRWEALLLGSSCFSLQPLWGYWQMA
jgi:hypothetical protein